MVRNIPGDTLSAVVVSGNEAGTMGSSYYPRTNQRSKVSNSIVNGENTGQHLEFRLLDDERDANVTLFT